MKITVMNDLVVLFKWQEIVELFIKNAIFLPANCNHLSMDLLSPVIDTIRTYTICNINDTL